MLFGHINISLTKVTYKNLMIHKCLSLMLLQGVHIPSFKGEADFHFSAITAVSTLCPRGSQGTSPR